MINPFKIFGYQARKYFWILQIKTLSGLYYSKEILWNVEQMVSCSQFFRLFSYTIHYYFCYFKHQTQFKEFNYLSQGVLIVPFIYGFYYSLRVYVQDKKSYLNLIKFASMLTLISLSQINIFVTFLPNYLLQSLIILCGLSVSYVDVKYDWGLLNKLSSNCLLRQILGYNKNFYYFSIFYNIVGRICLFQQLCFIIQSKTFYLFCVSLNPFVVSGYSQIISSIFMEFNSDRKEHVINIGEFKAVADILIEKDNDLMIELGKFLHDLNNQTYLKGSYKKKAYSLNLMIQKLEQNIEQKQI